MIIREALQAFTLARRQATHGHGAEIDNVPLLRTSTTVRRGQRVGEIPVNLQGATISTATLLKSDNCWITLPRLSTACRQRPGYLTVSTLKTNLCPAVLREGYSYARCGITLPCLAGLRIECVADIAHIAAAIAGDARLEPIGHGRRCASIGMAATVPGSTQRRGDFLRYILPVILTAEGKDGILSAVVTPEGVRQLHIRVWILRAVDGHYRQMFVALLRPGAKCAAALRPEPLPGAAELGEEGLDFEVNALPFCCQAGRDIQRP